MDAGSIVLSLGRYIAACCLASQRWVAPSFVFLVGVSITYAVGGGALTSLAGGATLLFPLVAWVTVGTLNDQDAGQAAITIAAPGGSTVCGLPNWGLRPRSDWR